MNKYLLDTSTLRHLMQDAPAIKARLESLGESDYLFICPIVKGEILFGIVRLCAGPKRKNLEQKANELFAKIPCDPLPDNVAEVYARTKAAAQKQGTSLGRCDLWIAATALALDSILVSSDSDYERIVNLGLCVENWVN